MSRAPDRLRPPYPVPWTHGCSCCATTGPCPWPRSSSPRSATPATGHPLLAAAVATITRVRDLFVQQLVDLGRPLAARRTGRRAPVSSSPTRAYASVLERLVAAGDGGRDLRRRPGRGRPSRVAGRASSPRAIDAFRPREWRHSGGEVLPGLVSGADLAAYSATLGGAGRPGLARRAGREDRPVGPGSRAAAGAGPARRAGRRRARPGHRGRHPRDRRELEAGDGRPRGLVRRPLAGRPSRTCSPPTTSRPARASSAHEADLGLRPGSPGGREPRLPEHVRRQVAGLPTGWSADVTTGEPTVEPRRDHEGRHRPHRRRRPLGQHDLRDAERWLAAELADHPRAGLLPGQPAADVLARAGAARVAGARRATAHHADADAGPSRR